MAIGTSIKGTILTITVDIADANFKASRSGKTEVVSTGGNVAIAGTELKLGLNVMKKAK
jgi:hypothetical protein